MYRQSHGRQYGFFGAYTDPVGRVYLVVVGDFAGHIGVLAVFASSAVYFVNHRAKHVAWHRDILEVRPPWTETRWPHTRGYGGGPVAIADFDGDGLDDIVLCYSSEYSIVKGNTGEQYIVETTGPLKGTDNFWVIGGWPLVADLNGDSVLETLWTSSSIILAFAHRERRAELLWRTEPNDGATGLPAIGDTNFVLISIRK